MADLMSILQANSQPPQGWASVGQALAGLGGAGREDSYNRGMARAAELDNKIQTARFNREKAMEAERQRENMGLIPARAIDAGYSQGDANLFAALVGAGVNPQTFTAARGNALNQGYQSEAADAARLDDTRKMNNLLTVLQGKPRETVKLADGTLFDPYGEVGQTVNTTPVGQSTIGQRNASAAASYASARNSDASAARTRASTAAAAFGSGSAGGPSFGGAKAPLGYRYLPNGDLEPIPGGPKDTGSVGADGGMLSDLNPRQKTGAQSVQRNLLSYAAALTGTPETELRKLSADEIAALMERKGSRGFQGGIARFARNLPGGQTLGDVLNSDVLSYSQGAGAGLAAYENPSGPISNADRETSTLQMPTYLDPVRVQANKTRNFLQSTGYQPAAAEAFGGAGVRVPSNSRIQPGPSVSAPPPGAIQALRSNPGLAEQFEAKYGPGSAANYLGR